MSFSHFGKEKNDSGAEWLRYPVVAPGTWET